MFYLLILKFLLIFIMEYSSPVLIRSQKKTKPKKKKRKENKTLGISFLTYKLLLKFSLWLSPPAQGDGWQVLLISLVARRLKRLPATQEARVQALGQEDLLEEEMETHSSILAWRIPWTEEPGRLQSTGLQRVGHGWATSLAHAHLFLYKYVFYLANLLGIEALSFETIISGNWQIEEY